MGSHTFAPMSESGRLWAPWRSAFLRAPRQRRCIFCRAAVLGKDRIHHVVARGRHALCLLNRYPYTNGHLLLAPYRHVGTLDVLTAEEWAELFQMSQDFTRRLRRTLHPQGFNLGMNLGRSAGAGIPGHLHLHLVPRWTGDTNFMSVMGNAKVLSQSLEELYDLLRVNAS